MTFYCLTSDGTYRELGTAYSIKEVGMDRTLARVKVDDVYTTKDEPMNIQELQIGFQSSNGVYSLIGYRNGVEASSRYGNYETIEIDKGFAYICLFYVDELEYSVCRLIVRNEYI